MSDLGSSCPYLLAGMVINRALVAIGFGGRRLARAEHAKYAETLGH